MGMPLCGTRPLCISLGEGESVTTASFGLGFGFGVAEDADDTWRPCSINEYMAALCSRPAFVAGGKFGSGVGPVGSSLPEA